MVTRNRLVLSITEPGPLSIASLRSQPAVGDFYAEATADISLCSGKDQYGMLFRASGSGDYYRFVLNCNGQVRLERVRGGVAYPLLDWFSSNDAPLGAPAQVKLGVWAVGREMRLFLNDHYQFSVVDPVFSTGTIGFFIYANGNIARHYLLLGPVRLFRLLHSPDALAAPILDSHPRRDHANHEKQTQRPRLENLAQIPEILVHP